MLRRGETQAALGKQEVNIYSSEDLLNLELTSKASILRTEHQPNQDEI